MRRVVIESPFKANEQFSAADNIKYARAALLDCLRRNEAPLASHLLYTQVLYDAVPEERKLGIEAGLAWHACADAIVVYTDLGISSGMKAAIAAANDANLTIEYRSLPEYAEKKV